MIDEMILKLEQKIYKGLTFNRCRGFNVMAKQSVQDDTTISFDKTKALNSLKATWTFIVKYRIWVLLLIPLLLAYNLRVTTADLDVTQRWATDTVHGNLRNQIAAQINAQHPNLDEAYRNELVNQQYTEFVRTNGDQIDQQIKQAADYFKSRLQDEDGVTYLLAIDSYFQLREAEAYVAHGHGGQILKDGVPFDPQANAPAGRVRIIGFHPWMTAWIYKMVSSIGIKTTLAQVAFYMPVIFSVLCVIPAFFIGWRIAGSVAGLFSGIVVAVHPTFLTRTMGGLSDTDPYAILFPLIIVWLVLEMLYVSQK